MSNERQFCADCKSSWLCYDDSYKCDKRNIFVDLNAGGCEDFEPKQKSNPMKRRIYDPSELYPGEDEVHEFYIVQT